MSQRVTIPLLHFNDVYRVRQKIINTSKALSADQFAALIHRLRKGWGEHEQESRMKASEEPFNWTSHKRRERKGLVIFSGDLFNPSVESSVTRGSHMVPVINSMQVDCAVLGNHDWDFGYPHLQRLLSKTNFPWLFSNVVDASWREDEASQVTEKPNDNDEQIEATLPYFVFEIKGIRVGCIGLVEKEWLDTVPGFPKEFEYRDMVEVGLKLSRELRQGPEKCDVILAVTHCRLPNDIKIANCLGATSNADPNQHGVDLILGGHDHVYYLGRGIGGFKGADFDHDMIGSEGDDHTLIVKSGTDFHDLSEVHISLSEPHPDSCVRRRTIEQISGTHQLSPDEPSLPELQTLLDKLMKRISKSTEQPVALSLNEWDVTSKAVRTDESGFGDFVADILLMSMERALRTQSPEQNEAAVSGGYRMADCCIICGGSLRSDGKFGPGEITLGNLMEIMPFDDPIVVKELTGQDIWDALENGFSAYPKQEGRFPQIAGMQVVWDSSKEPGHRVVSVDLLHQPFDGENTAGKDVFMKIRDSYLYEPDHCSNNEQSVMVHRTMPKVKKPLVKDEKYWVVTREYLAQGNDGYSALKRGRYVIDDESGQLMSALVRKFLLGATYIWRCNHLQSRKMQDHAVPDSPSASDSSFDSSFNAPARKRRRKSLLTYLFSPPNQEPEHLSLGTSEAVHRANEMRLRRSNSFQMERNKSDESGSASKTMHDPLFVDFTPTTIRDALFVAAHEHHSHYDMASRIDTNLVLEQGYKKEDLAVVVALRDGRMVDRGRQT